MGGGDEISTRNKPRGQELEGKNRKEGEEEQRVNPVPVRCGADAGGHRNPRTEADDCDGGGWGFGPGAGSGERVRSRCDERDFRRGEKTPRRREVFNGIAIFSGA
jgi:hypothetical protein